MALHSEPARQRGTRPPTLKWQIESFLAVTRACAPTAQVHSPCEWSHPLSPLAASGALRVHSPRAPSQPPSPLAAAGALQVHSPRAPSQPPSPLAVAGAQLLLSAACQNALASWRRSSLSGQSAPPRGASLGNEHRHLVSFDSTVDSDGPGGAYAPPHPEDGPTRDPCNSACLSECGSRRGSKESCGTGRGSKEPCGTRRGSNESGGNRRGSRESRGSRRGSDKWAGDQPSGVAKLWCSGAGSSPRPEQSSACQDSKASSSRATKAGPLETTGSCKGSKLSGASRGQKTALSTAPVRIKLV
mmetsp:Transcript_70765/g.229417  ORF Transcript_70765/g.229417 Transcript_70765/m.229417 type:complete len:301 (+) Transcript_70765:74-976(+)